MKKMVSDNKELMGGAETTRTKIHFLFIELHMIKNNNISLEASQVFFSIYIENLDIFVNKSMPPIIFTHSSELFMHSFLLLAALVWFPASEPVYLPWTATAATPVFSILWTRRMVSSS